LDICRCIEYYYVYVLLSEVDGQFYTGYTEDLNARLKKHNNGLVKSTTNRKPLKLTYWEGCFNQQDVTRREKYLKSGNGKIYIKSRLRNYFENPTAERS
jgi:putative endonuclease